MESLILSTGVFGLPVKNSFILFWLWSMGLFVFQVEEMNPHKIDFDLKTLGMIRLLAYEVLGLMEVVEESICKMFLDEKVCSFSFSFFS